VGLTGLISGKLGVCPGFGYPGAGVVGFVGVAGFTGAGAVLTPPLGVKKSSTFGRNCCEEDMLGGGVTTFGATFIASGAAFLTTVLTAFGATSLAATLDAPTAAPLTAALTPRLAPPVNGVATVVPNSNNPAPADLAAPAKSPLEALLITRPKSSTPSNSLAVKDPTFLAALARPSKIPTWLPHIHIAF
jgi:hypothetical protein